MDVFEFYKRSSAENDSETYPADPFKEPLIPVPLLDNTLRHEETFAINDFKVINGSLLQIITVTLIIPILSWTVFSSLRNVSYYSVQSSQKISKFGLDKISGFFGPGSWGSWVLTILSCLVDRAFATEKPTEAKRSHVLGLDINLVVAYAYPIIAGIDVLLHLRHYISNEASEADLGRLAASITVLRTGSTLGVVLWIVCLKSWGDGRSSFRTVLYTSTSTLFLLISVKIFDLYYLNLNVFRWILALMMIPQWGENERLASPLCQIASSFAYRSSDNVWTEDMRVRQMMGFGYNQNLDAYNSNSFRCVLAVVLGTYTLAGTYPSIIRLFLDGPKSLFGVLLDIGLLYSVGWPIMLLTKTLVDFMGLFVFAKSIVPVTTNALIDLDQMIALVLSGLLVLVYAVGENLHEKKHLFYKILINVIFIFNEHILSPLKGVFGGLAHLERRGHRNQGGRHWTQMGRRWSQRDRHWSQRNSYPTF